MTGGGGLGGGGGESASGLTGGCGVIVSGLRGSGVIVIEADRDNANPAKRLMKNLFSIPKLFLTWTGIRGRLENDCLSVVRINI